MPRLQEIDVNLYVQLCPMFSGSIQRILSLKPFKNKDHCWDWRDGSALGSLAAGAQDLGSVSSTYMVAPSHL